MSSFLSLIQSIQFKANRRFFLMKQPPALSSLHYINLEQKVQTATARQTRQNACADTARRVAPLIGVVPLRRGRRGPLLVVRSLGRRVVTLRWRRSTVGRLAIGRLSVRLLAVVVCVGAWWRRRRGLAVGAGGAGGRVVGASVLVDGGRVGGGCAVLWLGGCCC